MDRNRDLTTADLARADENVRGSRDEEVIGRGNEAVMEPPQHVDANARADVRRAEADIRPVPQRTNDERPATLFSEGDSNDLRHRWSDIQAAFVDEPRKAVERGDSLVADVMKRLAESFANERATLEKQWDRGDNVTTEDLRVTLQRYRSFFDRLLNV